MKNKTYAVIGSALAAVVAAGTLSIAAFAASNPADDVGGYSYNAGQKAYEERQAEYGFGDSDTVTCDSYCFNIGRQTNADRKAVYAGLAENATDEELEAFYAGCDIGGSAAYADGEYDEGARESYSYNIGYNSYQQRHSVFESN